MSLMSHLSHDWFPRPLPPNVVLGEGSWLYSAFAFLHCRSRRATAVRIGRHCGLYNSTFFELGPHGEVLIGDFCTVVGAIISTNGRVRIGDYCFIAHEVVIGDSAFAVPSPAGGCGACIELGDDVWVGAQAVLLDGARIGDGAIVGAGAVVDFEVPAYAIVAGNPARVVGSARHAGTDP